MLKTLGPNLGIPSQGKSLTLEQRSGGIYGWPNL
jgi:hypothetical protein